MNDESSPVPPKRDIKKKLIIVAVIALLVGAFFYFDLSQYLTLDYLKASREKFQTLYQEHMFLVIAAYFCIYIVVVALNLPGAAVMTVAGGALFGFLAGTVVVSFASSIGATLACFVARYLFRDVVQRKFGNKLDVVNRGIEREGAFYLFTMRLIPIFPFFAINLVMGLTGMRLWTFYWVSQVGMLPGTMAYVFAGRQLGQIDSLSGILDPGLIIAFVILGLFPLTMKKLMQFIRSKLGKKSIEEEAEQLQGASEE